jgi:endonuclease III
MSSGFNAKAGSGNQYLPPADKRISADAQPLIDSILKEMGQDRPSKLDHRPSVDALLEVRRRHSAVALTESICGEMVRALLEMRLSSELSQQTKDEVSQAVTSVLFSTTETRERIQRLWVALKEAV